MTPSRPALAACRRAVFSFGLMLSALPGANVFAAPGAHGPSGEHLETPAGGASASTAPGFETRSELFEIVGRLHSDELSLFVDRFDSNAPVMGATVEVESGGHKASATFHADLGDYSITDAALLAALKKAGEHALVLTVMAGDDADLLDATLVVGMPDADAGGDGHSHDERGVWFWLLVAAAVLGGLVLTVRVIRRNRRAAEAA